MAVAAMSNGLGNLERGAPGFLDGIHLQNVDIGMIGMQGMGAAGPSVSTLKKSQSTVDCRHPCVYQYGSCSFGDECKFADIDGKVCAKFLKGGCTWGNSCCWKHTSLNVKAKNVPSNMPNERRPNHNQRRMDEAMHEDLYNIGLSQQQLNSEMQQRNLFQQYQIQQQLNLPPNLLGGDLGGLPGMQGFQDDNRFDQLNQLPFSNLGGDNEPINHNTINQVLSTISGSIRDFDDRLSERVTQLQMAIDSVERERNEEYDRNRRSISALMMSVESLGAKLQDLGVTFAPYNPPATSGNSGNGNVNGGSNPMGPVSMSVPDQKAQPPPKDRTKVCHHCGKSGRLMLCGRCKVATFCNQECQREAWTTHAKTCQPPTDK
ncbi:hypothetical protein DIPPA_33326 [Diplonema papillatum]|nr:hypothetical protein DIPPA_33326 [Diplonema papillatum]